MPMPKGHRYSELRDNLQPFTPARLKRAMTQLRLRGSVQIVKGLPMYAVTSGGVVISAYRWKREPTIEFRILSNSPSRDGYTLVNLISVHGKRVPVRVHQLVADAFLPKPKKHQTEIRHLDGNPRNSHVGNLAWGTRQENMQDMAKHAQLRKNKPC